MYINYFVNRQTFFDLMFNVTKKRYLLGELINGFNRRYFFADFKNDTVLKIIYLLGF